MKLYSTLVINNTILPTTYSAQISLNIWSGLLSKGDGFTFTITRTPNCVPNINIPQITSPWPISSDLIITTSTTTTQPNDYFTDYEYIWSITTDHNHSISQYYAIANMLFIPQTLLHTNTNYVANVIIYDLKTKQYITDEHYAFSTIENERWMVNICGGDREIATEILGDRVGIEILLEGTLCSYIMDQIHSDITNAIYQWKCDGDIDAICYIYTNTNNNVESLVLDIDSLSDSELIMFFRKVHIYRLLLI